MGVTKKMPYSPIPSKGQIPKVGFQGGKIHSIKWTCHYHEVKSVLIIKKIRGNKTKELSVNDATIWPAHLPSHSIDHN